MLQTRQVYTQEESRRKKRMRGGRGAAVTSSIEEVVAVAVHTPPLMALQQVAVSMFGVGVVMCLLMLCVY